MKQVEVNFSRGLLVSRLSGEIAYPQIIDWIRDIERIEKQHPEGIDRFHDLSRMGTVDLNFERIFSAARRREERYAGSRPVKSAFLVSDELAYGLVRIYQSSVDEEIIDVQVFYEAGRAAEWLGVDVSSLSTEK